MFHMISYFTLEPDENIADFRKAYFDFVADMKRIDLLAETSPVGRRASDTPSRDTQSQMKLLTIRSTPR